MNDRLILRALRPSLRVSGERQGNSRCSCDQEGGGLKITNFPPEPDDPPNMPTMSFAGALRRLSKK